MKTQEFARLMANMLPDSAGLCTKYVVELAMAKLPVVGHVEKTSVSRIGSTKEIEKKSPSDADLVLPHCRFLKLSMFYLQVAAILQTPVAIPVVPTITLKYPELKYGGKCTRQLLMSIQLCG
jgi:hypothetical protein